LGHKKIGVFKKAKNAEIDRDTQSQPGLFPLEDIGRGNAQK